MIPPYASIEAILDHMEPGEERHFEELQADAGTEPILSHIYIDIQAVRRWLRSVWPNRGTP